jgi:hypothetical protein
MRRLPKVDAERRRDPAEHETREPPDDEAKQMMAGASRRTFRGHLAHVNRGEMGKMHGLLITRAVANIQNPSLERFIAPLKDAATRATQRGNLGLPACALP